MMSLPLTASGSHITKHTATVLSQGLRILHQHFLLCDAGWRVNLHHFWTAPKNENGTNALKYSLTLLIKIGRSLRSIHSNI